MNRRKPDSKRRWKARLFIGKWIPVKAVVDHQLGEFVNEFEMNVLTEHVRIPQPHESP